MAEEEIILLDDTCTMCSRSAIFINKHSSPGRFAFISLFSDEGKNALIEHGLSGDYTESVVLLADGKVWVKSDAILQICKRLKGLWPLCYAFIIIPRPLRDFVYKQISRHRHRFLRDAG